MAITGRIKTLFNDADRQEALFPRTKINAISDDNGVGLGVILEDMVYTGDDSDDTVSAPINADTLGGRPASEYATNEKVDALTYSDVGAAPAGFGLGETASYLDDFHSTVKSGFYYTDTNTKNRIQFCPEYASVLVVNGMATGSAYKLVFGRNYENGLLCLYFTIDYGTTWIAEWINPPMIEGVEYRTTERFNGKPVYRKLVVYRSSGVISGSFTVPHGISDFDSPVSCEANLNYDFLFPYKDSISEVRVSKLNSSGIRVENTNPYFDQTYYWVFNIAYTKNV